METSAGRWPNLFLIGAMRAGTTRLYQTLRAHPEIFMPALKEPNYFADDDYKAQYHNNPITTERNRPPAGEEQRHHAVIEDAWTYCALYSRTNGVTYFGDASPSYLPSPRSCYRIAARCPSATVLAILRNPLERAYSHYRMDLAIGRTQGSFHDAILRELDGDRVGSDFGYLGAGRYSEQLPIWLKTFGVKMWVTSLHALLADSAGTLARLSEFLRLDPFPEHTRSMAANSGVSARWPAVNRMLYRTGMKNLLRRSLPKPLKTVAKTLLYDSNGTSTDFDPETERLLTTYFAADIEAVRDLLDINLAHRTQAG